MESNRQFRSLFRWNHVNASSSGVRLARSNNEWIQSALLPPASADPVSAIIHRRADPRPRISVNVGSNNGFGSVHTVPVTVGYWVPSPKLYPSTAITST